jgi:outer membrane protein assembly factor BamB
VKLLRVLCLLPFCLPAFLAADDWPQWRGPNRDGTWNETGLVERFATPQLPVLWRAEISGGYTGPTVAAGRVYLSDRVAKPTEVERILCFDAMTGAPLWQHVYDCAYGSVSFKAGPRAAITLHDGRAYALGTMGHLNCLDAATGKVLWAKDMNALYSIRVPVWGICAAPLIEGPLVVLVVGGKDNACVVALDRVTGEERWKALADRACYAAPIVINQAGKRVLVCWTAERVVGLDVTSGQLLWADAFPEASRIIGVADPVCDGKRVFVTDFWQGSLMLGLNPDKPEMTRLWYRKGQSEQQTDALHALVVTPYVDGDYLYGVDSYGELRCLKAATGDRVWESLELLPKDRWGVIHMVRNQDQVWMFTEKGELAITKMSPAGLQVLSRAKLIEPTKEQHPRGVVWTHPAFANRCIYIRNDRELICASLAAEPAPKAP